MLTGWTWLNILNNHKSHKNTNTKQCVKQVSQSRDTNQLSLKLFCQATLVSLLGNLSFRFQRNASVKGGGVPPFSAKEKNLLFFTLIFRLGGRGGGTPLVDCPTQLTLVTWICQLSRRWDPSKGGSKMFGASLRPGKDIWR